MKQYQMASWKLINMRTGTMYTCDYHDWWCYVSILSVEEESSNSSRIYPIPAIDIVNVKLDSEIELVEIYNLNGEVVDRKTFSGSSNLEQINLSNHPPGIYFFEAMTNSGKVNGQIIKK